MHQSCKVRDFIPYLEKKKVTATFSLVIGSHCIHACSEETERFICGFHQ
jgi:hypothetical protein